MASFDTDSLRLALELHLRDVEGLQTTASGRKRKRKAGDFDVALDVYQEHLTAEILSVGGRVPATPIADAPSSQPRKRVATGKRKTAAHRARTPRPRRAELLVEQTAVSAQTVNAETEQETSVPVSAILEDTNTNKANAASMGVDNAAAASADVDNAGAVSTGIDSALRCSVCMEVQNENPTFRMPCEDWYCAPCLVEHVKATITGGLKFPPECCSMPIPIESLTLELLPADLVTQFEKKQLEHSTPNPRYCHYLTCGEFIPPSNFRGDYGTCGACGRLSCILCRAAKHDGMCHDDPARNAMLGMASEEGWQLCVSCGTLVERLWGCSHMFCHCGREFCYGCGDDWESCACSE